MSLFVGPRQWPLARFPSKGDPQTKKTKTVLLGYLASLGTLNPTPPLVLVLEPHHIALGHWQTRRPCSLRSPPRRISLRLSASSLMQQLTSLSNHRAYHFSKPLPAIIAPHRAKGSWKRSVLTGLALRKQAEEQLPPLQQADGTGPPGQQAIGLPFEDTSGISALERKSSFCQRFRL